MSAKQSEAQDVRSLCTNPIGLHTGGFNEFHYHTHTYTNCQIRKISLRIVISALVIFFSSCICNFRMIIHFEKNAIVDYCAQVSRLYIELGRHMVCASLTQKCLNLLHGET